MTKQNSKTKTVKLTKRQKAWADKVNSETTYSLEEAVKLLKACAKAKFDESVDVAINLGLDTKLADQQLRGVVAMPNGNGKKVRVAVFAKGDAAAAAEKAGAEVVGADDLVAKVKKGFLDFDRVVATPDCMPLVGQLGQILGPKGLMPNPKVGTVTANPAKAVQDIKAGLTEYRAEKTGIVQAQVAKASFTEKQLVENITALVSAVKAAKPASVKGIYMRKVTINTTMGPGIRVDFNSIA
jgi:large subunit ribosomal protein L1